MTSITAKLTLKYVCLLLAALVIGDVSQAGTYQYDELNRLTRIIYDDGTAIVFEYDAAGNRTMRVMNNDPAVVHLSVHIDPDGFGIVAVDPAQNWYAGGTPVTLTADVGDCAFLGWSGDVPPGSELDNPLMITMDDYKSITLNVSPSTGDMDGDTDLDFADVTAFLGCLAGPDVASGAGCEPADLTCDGDADIADFAELQRRFGAQ